MDPRSYCLPTWLCTQRHEHSLTVRPIITTNQFTKTREEGTYPIILQPTPTTTDVAHTVQWYYSSLSSLYLFHSHSGVGACWKVGGDRRAKGRGLGRGRCPLPRNFFEFVSESGEFWCILSDILAGVCTMQLQESQEMNREEIKKERETITLLKYTQL